MDLTQQSGIQVCAPVRARVVSLYVQQVVSRVLDATRRVRPTSENQWRFGTRRLNKDQQGTNILFLIGLELKAEFIQVSVILWWTV